MLNPGGLWLPLTPREITKGLSMATRHTIASPPDTGDTTWLVSEAISYAGPSLPRMDYASDLDRAMAAADLAGAIRATVPMLTAAERAAFARHLAGGVA